MKVLTPSLAAIDSLRVDSVAVCITTDVRPLSGASGFLDWRMCGRISRLLVDEKMTGAVGETLLTASNLPHVERVFLFGFGHSSRVERQCRETFALMTEVLQKAKVESVVVALPPSPYESLVQRAEKGLHAELGNTLVGVFTPERPWHPNGASPSEDGAKLPASAPAPAKGKLDGRSA